MTTGALSATCWWTRSTATLTSEQVSVRADWQGVGLGRALLDRVREWAADHGMLSITFTTFSAVPWNRPL